MRVSGAETTSVCASVFIGQTEAPLTVRPYIPKMTESELITMMIGGMSRYSPAQRFDQHKQGIRAAGSVLKRGIEVLTGPVLHLQHIRRGEAARIEAALAGALEDAGIRVEGGH